MKPLSVPQAEKKPLEFKTLIDADAVPASVICLVFLLTRGALENFLADYAIKNSLPSGGIFFAITAVMLFLVRVTIGKLADKKGEGIFVYSCNAAMLAAFLLLAFAPGNFSFYLAAVLAGYAFGGIEPALQSMAVHIAPPERRGSANSTFLCAYDIGLGGGGGIAGVLISALGYRSMYLILSGYSRLRTPLCLLGPSSPLLVQPHAEISGAGVYPSMSIYGKEPLRNTSAEALFMRRCKGFSQFRKSLSFLERLG